METPKIYLMFQEMELSYISGNGKPEKHFIFQEITFQVKKMKNSHS